MRLRGLLIGSVLTTAAVTAGSQQQSAPSVQFTTTDRLEGCTISRYLGVVTAVPRIGGDRAPNQQEFPATTERQLLYVACTRARGMLLVTAAEPGSEFLDDLVKSGTQSR